MDILISESWLRDFLKTKAETKKIAEVLTLSGSSVERITETGGERVFHIEVTTNRIDSASIYGIAREANTSLKRYGVASSLTEYINKKHINTAPNVDYLTVINDYRLCPRFSAILIENVNLKDSPPWLQKRLLTAGFRPINNLVDITNYLMQEAGQPLHVFDYDKIKGSRMILRESLKGEKVTTLDGKTHSLPGGNIVIEDGEKRLIDLCGIMGGELSAVDEKTKNILLFVQKYNPSSIRRTSMNLSLRSQAAAYFEKDIDAENILPVLNKAVEMFSSLANGKPKKYILDLYKSKYKPKTVKVNLEFINKMSGINFKKDQISPILNSLGFAPKWNGKFLSVLVPSFRAKDIDIKEDLVEEIVRVWGYDFISDIPLTGALPAKLQNSPFLFERKVKGILKELKGIEVYTSSLVSKEDTDDSALKIANPLGKEGTYLRTSLKPSLLRAVDNNKNTEESYLLFEMANIYLPRKGDLPKEKVILAGIFSNYEFRIAKGAVEYLLQTLNIDHAFSETEKKGYIPGCSLLVKSGSLVLGEMGLVKQDLVYFEFEAGALQAVHIPFRSYRAIPKYPSQSEDLTLIFPAKTKIGEVVKLIYQTSPLITDVEYLDSYKDAVSFRVKFLDKQKTLTNEEVALLRINLLKAIKVKFGGVEKS